MTGKNRDHSWGPEETLCPKGCWCRQVMFTRGMAVCLPNRHSLFFFTIRQLFCLEMFLKIMISNFVQARDDSDTIQGAEI